MAHGPEELVGAIAYPIQAQALPDIMARCPGGVGEAPVRLAAVANTVMVTGAQPALLRAVEEALALART
eukprot:4088465-Alexandrium_andersonii.AAC.1